MIVLWGAIIGALISAAGSIGGAALSKSGSNAFGLKLPEPGPQEKRLISTHEALLQALRRDIERNILLRLAALPALMDIGRFNLNPKANENLFDLLPEGIIPPALTGGEGASRPVRGDQSMLDNYVLQKVARERKGKPKKKRQLLDRISLAKNELQKIINVNGRVTETDLGIVSDVSKLDAELVEALLPAMGIKEIFRSVI